MGASYSIFPHQSSEPVSGPVLKGPGGQIIPCCGKKLLPVQFSGRRFTWTFLLAKVEFPILGADFLKHFNLIVDLTASQLLATDTLQRFAAGPPAATAAAAQTRGGLFPAVESTPPLFRGVFNEFQDVASSSGSLPPVKHKTLHHIHTTGPPAMAPFRHPDTAKLATAKAEFIKLKKDRIPQPDGTWWPCGDYRRLNLATTPDTYPLPNIQDLSARLGGCTIFSKLDLRKGYYQIPVQEGDIHDGGDHPLQTLGISPHAIRVEECWAVIPAVHGRSPEGLNFAFCYLDDILIGSSSPDQHLLHLHLVLQRLQQYGLVLNLEKCEIGRVGIDIFGHHITAEGASPITRHVDVIQQFPQPQDKKQLQSFLGLVNFYRRFIPAVTQILLPLTDALRSTRRGEMDMDADDGPQLWPHQVYTLYSGNSYPPGSVRRSMFGCQQHSRVSSSTAAVRIHLETSRLLQQEAGLHTVE